MAMELNIKDAIEVLVEARRYVECCCEEDRSDPASVSLAKLDALIVALKGAL